MFQDNVKICLVNVAYGLSANTILKHCDELFGMTLKSQPGALYLPRDKVYPTPRGSLT